MTKLLFIQASPRKADSKSVQIATAYLSALRAQTPGLDVDILELWDTDLPQFDGDKAAAKMNAIVGNEQTGVQKTAWDQITEIAQRFISADRYLFAVPMWNAGIPYRLKQYIDLIHQPGLLWTLDPDTGYHGLLRAKHATVVYTSGVYAPGVQEPAYGVDHHAAYLTAWLNQANVSEIDELRFQPSMLTPDPAGDLEKAIRRAVELAERHGHV